ncbi:MAG: polysaccharide biosynthesis/export family protein [Flavobacterium sp.]|nr:polysaccharide biosynthesis/export family protein [Flavobacterium sp.]
MNTTFRHTAYFITIFLILTSCASSKKIIYVQDADKFKESLVFYKSKLEPDDKLSIIVSAQNPELTAPFNMPEIQTNYTDGKTQQNIKTFLIDNAGYINYPIVGKIKLAGLTKAEAIDLIVEKISEYFKSPPTVNLEIMNFKVSILGEVKNPMTIDITSDRFTILEALTKAGDLTIYGKRENVLLIREVNGIKTFNRINLTNTDFINSPFYYLMQNDVIFVEPNKTAINNSAVGANISLIISTVSIFTTLIFFLVKK